MEIQRKDLELKSNNTNKKEAFARDNITQVVIVNNTQNSQTLI